MISLFLDTSSSYLYAGIVKDNTLLASRKKEYGKDLSKEALKEVIDMMEEVPLSPKTVDKIFVVTGPGSFTGVRIGVTIAKTYAWSLKKDIVPVSSLRAMALSYEGDSPYVMPLLDARRGYVFGGLYQKDGTESIKEQYLPLSKLEELAASFDKTVVTNDPLKVIEKKDPYTPNVLKIVEYYQKMQPINPHLVNPNYLKKTEAEEKQEVC